ncbi:rhs family protein [hydrocarbon metagenome]|uniref:Rhs family protein n=1 Tax=hydrocarbon metagenome TaxID=938273 RepID=A0A0W8FRD0_9ZZZZ
MQTYTYDSFGNITISGSISQPFTYTGREYDSETGMYFYRARYYDPKIGRFVTKDPIGFEGGINVYAYVENNPVNTVDPEGKQAPRITPQIPGYWSYLIKIAPRVFCSLLQQKITYVEEQNKQCKDLGLEDNWEIDPDAYNALNWCKNMEYIK